MIVIESQGKEYHVKSKISELTLGEFEFISEIFARPESNVSKWMDIVCQMTTIERGEIESWSSVKFQELINMLFINDLPETKLDEIKIGDKTYKVSEHVSARDLTILEKLFNDNKTGNISCIIASRFKDTSLTIGENYDINIIKERAELFKELNVVGLVPYLYESVYSFIDYLKINSVIKVNNDPEPVS